MPLLDSHTPTLRISDDEVCEGTGDVLCGKPATCIVEVPVKINTRTWMTEVFAACDECACEDNAGEIVEVL